MNQDIMHPLKATGIAQEKLLIRYIVKPLRKNSKTIILNRLPSLTKSPNANTNNQAFFNSVKVTASSSILGNKLMGYGQQDPNSELSTNENSQNDPYKYINSMKDNKEKNHDHKFIKGSISISTPKLHEGLNKNTKNRIHDEYLLNTLPEENDINNINRSKAWSTITPHRSIYSLDKGRNSRQDREILSKKYGGNFNSVDLLSNHYNPKHQNLFQVPIDSSSFVQNQKKYKLTKLENYGMSPIRTDNTPTIMDQIEYIKNEIKIKRSLSDYSSSIKEKQIKRMHEMQFMKSNLISEDSFNYMQYHENSKENGLEYGNKISDNRLNNRYSIDKNRKIVQLSKEDEIKLIILKRRIKISNIFNNDRTLEEKKAIYKQLLLEYHPDKCNHDKQISEDIFGFLQANKGIFLAANNNNNNGYGNSNSNSNEETPHNTINYNKKIIRSPTLNLQKIIIILFKV